MIKQIKYFKAVVKYKSFTQAAEKCYISQSAISQQIMALEQNLGARLNAIAPGIIVTPLAIDEFNGPRGDFYKILADGGATANYFYGKE